MRAIHGTIVRRALKLSLGLSAPAPLVLTGGLACDRGLVRAVRDAVELGDAGLEFRVAESPLYAGAVGTALWGGVRREFGSRRIYAHASSSLASSTSQSMSRLNLPVGIQIFREIREVRVTVFAWRLDDSGKYDSPMLKSMIFVHIISTFT